MNNHITRYEIKIRIFTDCMEYYDTDDYLSVCGVNHQDRILDLPSRTMKSIKADLDEDEIYYDDIEILHWKAI